GRDQPAVAIIGVGDQLSQNFGNATTDCAGKRPTNLTSGKLQGIFGHLFSLPRLAELLIKSFAYFLEEANNIVSAHLERGILKRSDSLLQGSGWRVGKCLEHV